MGLNANLVVFPRTDLRGQLGEAMKRHRLPEKLGQALMREAANFPEVSADAALAFAIAQRLSQAPIDFQTARGILLAGPRGAGKSAVAAKIARAAVLSGRKVAITRADMGLAQFRTRSVRESGSDNKKNSNPPKILTIMEADGFNPLNPRAASAFRALGEIENVETIGVISALQDAEDVSDLVSAFRFPRVIVTHMDLTRRLGAALAAAMSGAKLAYVTHSARVEDGLDVPTPGALATQMLDIAAH